MKPRWCREGRGLGVEHTVKERLTSIEAMSNYLTFSKKRELSEMKVRFDTTLLAMKQESSYTTLIEKLSE